MREQNEKAVQAMRAFLKALGLDLEQCGMEQTPERVARLYGDLFDGLGKDPASIWGERFASETKGIVAVRHIPFYSVCEHHLLPFFGEVSLAYLPHDGVACQRTSRAVFTALCRQAGQRAAPHKSGGTELRGSTRSDAAE